MPSSAENRVHAVVVTYRCGETVQATLNALLFQVEAITVIDNASGDDTAAFVRAYAQGNPKVFLIENAVNNLAAAQNLGIGHALATGCDRVLLMDHDSIPEAGMIAAMLDESDRYADSARVGMIVPNLIETGSAREVRYLRRAGWLFRRSGFGNLLFLDDVMVAIASGSLIRRDVFARIGLMNEAFGIDDVDRDFSLRCIAAGYRILAVRDARLQHHIGASRDHALGLLRLTVRHHPAIRRYTIYRNRILCWRMHGRRFPGFVLFDAGAIVYDQLRILLFEGDKRAKLAATWKGLRDGLSMKIEAIVVEAKGDVP